MKTFLYIVIILVLIVLAFIPIFIGQDFKSSISVSAEIISAFSSLVTLLIALLLFDKYGLKKNIIERKTETVLKLLEKVRKTRLLLRGERSVIHFCPLKEWQDTYEQFNTLLVVFDVNYLDFIKSYFSDSKSLYLPPKIVDKFKKLEPTVLVHDIANLPKNEYLKVTIPGYPKGDESFGRFNGSDLTFYEFNNLWIDLHDEILNWLKANDIDTNDLNIEAY